MATPLLQVADLALRRDGRDNLRGVNLTVCAGQIHALLGLNGSGKSSLAYAVMGCAGYGPNAGTICFDGRNLAGLSITERARLGITLAQAEARNTPVVIVRDDQAQVTHEAAIGTVNHKELATLLARGLDEDEAVDLIIRGLIR